jgi:hypothetical protein
VFERRRGAVRLSAPAAADGPGLFGRLAELRGLLDEVADIDWRNPLWWALTASSAAALGWTPQAGYLASDAEPRADTFMGWPAPAPTSAADAIADAIVRAHAAARALADLDGALPEQPLAVSLIVGDGAAAVRATDVRRVAFVIGDRAYLARLADGAGSDGALAAALARAAAAPTVLDARLEAIDGRGPCPAAIAVVVGDQPAAVCRHQHRRAWTAGGGPWLGLGRAGALATVSTCHLVVDGYGHAWLSARIAADRDDDAHAVLAAAARAADPIGALPALPPLALAQPLGVAWRQLPRLPRFAELAHAVGRVLHADEGQRAARRSPTFQVPVAPGDRTDPLRRRRRVVPALLSVRFPDGDGRAEALAVLAERADAVVRREAAGAGLMSRLLDAARAAPAPLAWKRRMVGSASRPLLLASISRVLGGRACLSILRLGAEIAAAPPLVAVSSPGLLPSILDPIGSTVLTAIGDDRGATITASGCGRTGDADGAEAILDRLQAALAAP